MNAVFLGFFKKNQVMADVFFQIANVFLLFICQTFLTANGNQSIFGAC